MSAERIDDPVVARGRAFTIEQRGLEEVVAAYDVATSSSRRFKSSCLRCSCRNDA